MLHDPARHQALRPIAWDEAHVRATISHIVDATVAAFSPQTLWPPHPRDLEPGDDPDAPATCLYWGASGVVWALDYLTAAGLRPRRRSPGTWTRCASAIWPPSRAAEGDNAGSYLMGDLPSCR